MYCQHVRAFLGITLWFLLTFPTLLVANDSIPFKLPAPQDLSRIRSAMLVTSKGKIYFKLYPKDAPWHVANFKYLADKGFYRGKRFHLFHENYIIQGGAPTKNPNSGPGYTLPPEFNDRTHLTGTLGMARKIDLLNKSRRSNGSQFHILLDDSPHLNGTLTVFGRVVKGMDVVRKLRKGDTIKDLKVYVKANTLKPTIPSP